MSDRLPGPEFRALLHPHTGDVAEIQRTERGFSSDLTAVVECQRGPLRGCGAMAAAADSWTAHRGVQP